MIRLEKIEISKIMYSNSFYTDKLNDLRDEILNLQIKEIMYINIIKELDNAYEMSLNKYKEETITFDIIEDFNAFDAEENKNNNNNKEQ